MSSLENHLIAQTCLVAQALFAKDFLSIFHGSLSVKINNSSFLINRHTALFHDFTARDMVKIYDKKDYRWSEASVDASVHVSIYKNLSGAKCIACCVPPFMSAYALTHDRIVPQDYWGSRLLKEMIVYDPREFETWHERAEGEISRFLKENKSSIIVVRGYGVYLHARDLLDIVKAVTILEHSCKMLFLSGGDAKEHSDVMNGEQVNQL